MNDTLKTITFMPTKKKVEFSGRPSILEVALANAIPLNHSCGAMGSCTTCRVFVKAGHFPPRNELEQDHATERNFAVNERLACQTEAISGSIVEIPEDEPFD